ncbi:hypothetical protein FGO68_gene9690 [Halteria grandinella]|uniref:Uncharacterized protein n=1 Tax=Halteria grandinella TaxID=5974 RepID=A0A8J8NUH2_HALGN|nr:hypothetical protein FGO68_gene9690 [Halteria grandinella]
MSRKYNQQTAQYDYFQNFKGMTFDMLSSIIYGKDSSNISDKPVSFSQLEADVNFSQSIDHPIITDQQKLKMGLIGAVPACKLTDYESEFSFEMLFKFLDSQVDSSKDYEPIELKIAKFSESWAQPQNASMSFQDKLKEIALSLNLEVPSIQQSEKEMRMEIQMKNKIARKLVVIYDRNQEGSMFRLKEFQEYFLNNDEISTIPNLNN